MTILPKKRDTRKKISDTQEQKGDREITRFGRLGWFYENKRVQDQVEVTKNTGKTNGKGGGRGKER